MSNNTFIEPQPEETGYTKTFWIGLGVSVITNLIQAFALSFQRKSHLLNDSLPIELRKGSFKRPMWTVAFFSFISANLIGSIFSIGYLPIVILAPIGAMNLVFNTFAAYIVLGDPLSRKNIIGTGLIAFGALLVGFFGVIPEPNHSLEDLMRLYRKNAFIIYFAILESFILALMILTHFLEHKCIMAELKDKTGLRKIYGFAPPDLKKWVGISYGVLSGNVSSQSMLFAKSGIELIILTVAYQQNQLQYPLTWFLLVMMVLTAGMQLFYLNKGLKLCDNLILVPLSFCAFNVSCLFNGLVYYDQWDRLRWYQIVFVMLGVIVTVYGVVLLSWKSSAEFTEELQEEERSALLAEGESDDDEEERRDYR
ncbi:hypothetical protein K501DRAFT_260463 [Backusella circina FSU 941]|nr:hypothetical protein K501DRAFT_260463 [Backusella circina FSU 941]